MIQEIKNPIIFVCKKCNYEDLPENYHGVMYYDKNEGSIPMRMIGIECPNCNNKSFFTHFPVTENPEKINFDMMRQSMSHNWDNSWRKNKK